MQSVGVRNVFFVKWMYLCLSNIVLRMRRRENLAASPLLFLLFWWWRREEGGHTAGYYGVRVGIVKNGKSGTCLNNSSFLPLLLLLRGFHPEL